MDTDSVVMDDRDLGELLTRAFCRAMDAEQEYAVALVEVDNTTALTPGYLLEARQKAADDARDRRDVAYCDLVDAVRQVAGQSADADR